MVRYCEGSFDEDYIQTLGVKCVPIEGNAIDTAELTRLFPHLIRASTYCLQPSIPTTR